MKVFYKIVIILLAVVFVNAIDASAQCAMCKAAQNSSGFSYRGLNMGILYLMAIPYIAFSVLGYFWYKASKKQRKADSL